MRYHSRPHVCYSACSLPLYFLHLFRVQRAPVRHDESRHLWGWPTHETYYFTVHWHAVTYPNGPLRSLCVLCVLTSHPPGPTCAPASRPTCMGNALASSEYSTQHLSREVEVGVHVSCHALSLSTYLSSLSLPALARCQVRMVLQ